MSRQDDIVVTGMGVICAGAASVKDLWFRLQYSHDGIGVPKHLVSAHSDLPMGEVAESNEELGAMTHTRGLSRTALLGLYAARQAINDAGGICGRTAFISGTTVGNMDAAEQGFMDFFTGKRESAPGSHDCGACTLDIVEALNHKFAFTSTISTACSSAANAIINGAEMLRLGLIDSALVGGTEALSAFHVGGFNSLMILDPEHCRPLDESRRGLNLGEGAAYLVLERRQDAEARGARILAVLTGAANACDAYHQTATSPDGVGLELAMRQAIADANISPSDIGYINLHGTGTQNNDATEAKAVSAVFDVIPPVSSTKYFTGHTTSASGAIEAVISIICLHKGMIPGNPGVDNPVPQLEDAISKSPVRKDFNAVMTNSFGFGGNDSSLIFVKP